MHIFPLNQLAQFNDKSPGVQVIARSGPARHVLFSFQAGQSLPEHTTSSQIAVQVVSGQLTFTLHGETRELEPGQLLLLEAGVPLVFSSLLVGVASLCDVRKLGRMGGKTLALYLCTRSSTSFVGWRVI